MVQKGLFTNLTPNTVVILDNTSYHLVIRTIPNTASKKEEIIEFLYKQNIFLTSRTQKNSFWKLREFNLTKKKNNTMIAGEEHTILRLHPYH